MVLETIETRSVADPARYAPEWTMPAILNYMTVAAAGAVAVVLVLGLANMLRAGTSSRSQMLMRWRVGLQFIAIIIAMGLLYVTR